MKKKRRNDTNNIPEMVVQEKLKAHARAVEGAVIRIIKDKFNVDPSDPDAFNALVAKKKLTLCYTEDHAFVGLVSNNRWLYTIDGKVIGKNKDGEFKV